MSYLLYVYSVISCFSGILPQLTIAAQVVSLMVAIGSGLWILMCDAVNF
jgi:hypothetical protein